MIGLRKADNNSCSESLDCPHKIGGRAKRRGYYLYTNSYHLPLYEGKKPSALLWGDKSPVVVTDAFIPRRPPTLGGESQDG